MAGERIDSLSDEGEDPVGGEDMPSWIFSVEWLSSRSDPYEFDDGEQSTVVSTTRTTVHGRAFCIVAIVLFSSYLIVYKSYLGSYLLLYL